jgi:hypothetical protein
VQAAVPPAREELQHLGENSLLSASTYRTDKSLTFLFTDDLPHVLDGVATVELSSAVSEPSAAPGLAERVPAPPARRSMRGPRWFSEGTFGQIARQTKALSNIACANRATCSAPVPSLPTASPPSGATL